MASSVITERNQGDGTASIQRRSAATADGRGHHNIHRKKPLAIMQRIKQYVIFA
jgi:hypothetical protein